MIRIAICDDNALQLEMLGDILQSFAESSGNSLEVSAFNGGKALLDTVQTGCHYDIYILDMIMPDINGMEVASTLRIMKDNGIIIFITATQEYAVASYDVAAFYYMMKPVDPARLERVLSNAIAELNVNDRSIVIRTASGEILLNTDDITYVSLENRALHYHMRDGRIAESLTIRVSFKEAVSSFLNIESFSLCGVSMLVNMRYIDAMDTESILLRDGTVLYPSKTGCAALKKAWKAYLRK